MDGTSLVDHHRPLIALHQLQPLVGKDCLESGGGAGGGPGVQHPSAGLGQRDAGALLLVPLLGCQRCDGARAEGIAVVYQGAVHVGALAVKGVQDSPFVATG